MTSDIVGEVAAAIGPRLRVNILRGGASSHQEIDALIVWVALIAVSAAMECAAKIADGESDSHIAIAAAIRAAVK